MEDVPSETADGDGFSEFAKGCRPEGRGRNYVWSVIDACHFFHVWSSGCVGVMTIVLHLGILFVKKIHVFEDIF